jgi:hypothetical protein
MALVLAISRPRLQFYATSQPECYLDTLCTVLQDVQEELRLQVIGGQVGGAGDIQPVDNRVRESTDSCGDGT